MRASTLGNDEINLLEVFHAAQQTNRATFRGGAISAVVHMVVGPETGGSLPTTVSDVAAQVTWGAALTYCTYDLTESAGASVSRQKGELIKNADELICYWPEAKFAQRIREGAMNSHEALRLRPDEIWFKLEGDSDWLSYFDPAMLGAGAQEGWDVRVVADAEDRIVIVRKHPEHGGLRIVASLRDDGNVLSYETLLGTATRIWRKGEYEWTRAATGELYLKKYTYKRSSTADPNRPDRQYILDVGFFDPSPSISRDRFTFASLHLPEGTTVEEVSKSSSRRYKIGEDRQTLTARLDRLAKKLAARGFAAAGDHEATTPR